MLNVVQLHDPSDLSLKVGAIVKVDILWYSKQENDIVLYELGHMLGLQNGIGSYFYLFGEVVNRD